MPTLGTLTWSKKAENRLQLLHSNDIGRLDVILELLNLLLQLGETNLVILDNQVNLQFLDTETNSDKLGSTPDKTLLIDATDGCLELLHVGLIIPRLDIHSHDGLSSRLSFAFLLLSIFFKTFISDSLGLGILLLVITAEQVDIIILLLSSGRCLCWVQGDLCDIWAVGCVWLGSVTRESGELLSV